MPPERRGKCQKAIDELLDIACRQAPVTIAVWTGDLHGTVLDNRSESNMHTLRDLGLNRDSSLVDLIPSVHAKIMQHVREKPTSVMRAFTLPNGNIAVRQYARIYTDPVLEAVSSNLSRFSEYRAAVILSNDPASARPCCFGTWPTLQTTGKR